jgi:hypothetical protein
MLERGRKIRHRRKKRLKNEEYYTRLVLQQAKYEKSFMLKEFKRRRQSLHERRR